MGATPKEQQLATGAMLQYGNLGALAECSRLVPRLYAVAGHELHVPQGLLVVLLAS